MDFEQLRIIDLVKKFQAEIEDISSTRSLKKIKAAGVAAQNIYDFLLTSQNPFTDEQELFKNLFSSFNYAAVIVNDALKKGGLSKDDNALLNDCFEIMLRCCEKIIASIDK